MSSTEREIIDLLRQLVESAPNLGKGKISIEVNEMVVRINDARRGEGFRRWDEGRLVSLLDDAGIVYERAKTAIKRKHGKAR